MVALFIITIQIKTTERSVTTTEKNPFYSKHNWFFIYFHRKKPDLFIFKKGNLRLVVNALPQALFNTSSYFGGRCFSAASYWFSSILLIQLCRDAHHLPKKGKSLFLYKYFILRTHVSVLSILINAIHKLSKLLQLSSKVNRGEPTDVAPEINRREIYYCRQLPVYAGVTF